MAVGTQAWGAASWGYGKSYTRDDLYAAYRAALDAGMNFIDTSDSYGVSEELIGEFRQQDGRDVVLATKFSPSIFFDRSERTSPEHVMPTLDESLRRLRTERIDLYQMHYPVDEKRLDGFLEEFVRAVKAGKVQAVGVSNFNLSRMEYAHKFLADHGIPLASNQISYTLLHRTPERNGVLDVCAKLNVAVIALMPLLQGIMTGKYRVGGPDYPRQVKIVMRVMQADLFHEARNRPSLLRRMLSKPYALRREALEPLFEVMAQVAKDHEASIAQVALNWLLASDDRVIPIVGAKNRKQAQDNARTLQWSLSRDEYERINRAEAMARDDASMG